MVDRSRDWLAQAERDLGHAERSRDGEEHEWACFAAHQAAEKAVKALHLARGQDAWGHGVSRLREELPLQVPRGLIDAAKVLDASYIPSRYPDSHSEGAPFQHYGPLQSEEAVKHAGQIVAYVRSQMA
jgi:HEPN domain-containing protein